MRQIRWIIHHTHEMNGVILGEMQNLVPCPDLIAFVRRVSRIRCARYKMFMQIYP